MHISLYISLYLLVSLTENKNWSIKLYTGTSIPPSPEFFGRLFYGHSNIIDK